MIDDRDLDRAATLAISAEALSEPPRLCSVPVMNVLMLSYYLSDYVVQATQSVMDQVAELELELLIGEDGNRLTQAGFEVARLGIDHFGARTFRTRGISPTSAVYLVSKPHSD